MNTLQREQWVPRPLTEVFAFFSDAGNLETITPAWLKFQIVPPRPLRMEPGALIHYRIRWHAIPLRWTTRITRWEPPHLFEDIQLSGPYKSWRHLHRFASYEGGTRISDDVHYELPLGGLGQLAHRLLVRRNVNQIFDYRQSRIGSLFGAGRAL
jgi:ligand-binding SRPBCC domain-containing protein